MEITKLEVFRREREGSRLKAFVDFTLDDCLAIRGAKIIQGTIAAAAVINEIIAVIIAKKGFEWAGELSTSEEEQSI